MGCRYYTCDVFTDRAFCGNPLAVLPEAHGLSDAQMLAIAREFNDSETTFVLPPHQALPLLALAGALLTLLANTAGRQAAASTIQRSSRSKSV